MPRTAVLDQAHIRAAKHRVEAAIVPAMERLYGHGRTEIPDSFRPELKQIERIVSFYDYWACGISVLAPMAVAGDVRARELVGFVQNNMKHYRTEIFGRFKNRDNSIWAVPLRRLLFHAALACQALGPKFGRACRSLVEQQVEAAIEHNQQFHPSEKDLHLGFANNHTAIFMQGVYYCGQVFRRPAWTRLAHEFAERFYASGHADGYWEENTNTRREGGPSIVYTPLTAGCLFDVLDGPRRPRAKFLRAGEFYRSFLNHDGDMIPLADERTNATGRHAAYGLALHSLTPRGRGHIVQMLDTLDFAAQTPEGLAVLYHELDLMRTGPCETPEYLADGKSRITLPLGVIRKNGWTAGISALRALNRVRQPRSDYALDQQAIVYLAHCDAGVVLTGLKSKNDTEYSTFRIGQEDGFPIDTGTLQMGDGWAEARLVYAKFEAIARWEIARWARLTLTTQDNREVTTTLPIHDPKCIRTNASFSKVKLKGLSPYSAGNAADPVTAARFLWRKKLVVEFDAGLATGKKHRQG